MRRTLLFTLLIFGLRTPLFAEDSALDLAKILRDKGVITNSDLAALEAAGGADRLRLLTSLLKTKGVLTDAEATSISQSPPDQTPAARLIPTVATTILAAATSSATPAAAPPQAPAKGPETNAAPPVTSQSKSPVTVYGTIVLNAFFDTSLNNIEDVPLLASKAGSDPFPDDKTFGMTARQSRLGLRYQGPDVAGAKLSGQVEVDFFEGTAAFTNGINMDLLRLRLALGRLDWRNFLARSRAGLVRLRATQSHLFRRICYSRDVGFRQSLDPHAADSCRDAPRTQRHDQIAVADRRY
jgi:hypothetical protein